MYPKHILMTGATSGFGLQLLEKVIEELERCNNVHVCLICEKFEKGAEIQNSLFKKHPHTKIIPVEIDLGCVRSVLHGCLDIKNHFRWLDLMILNAEILPREELVWENLAHAVMSSLNGKLDLFWLNSKLRKTKQNINQDGHNAIFAVNILGHFVLVQQLLPLLSRGTYGEERDYAQVIWSTSSFSSFNRFDSKDIFCRYGPNTYSRSKYVLEAVSAELNNKFNSKGIFSHVCSPGAMITKFQTALPSFPYYLWYFFTPLLLLGRILVPNLTLFHDNACYSFLWLLKQNPRDLDPKAKYCSSTSFLNRNYILKETIRCGNTEAIYEEVNNLTDNSTSRLWLDIKFQELKESLVRFHLV